MDISGIEELAIWATQRILLIILLVEIIYKEAKAAIDRNKDRKK